MKEQTGERKEGRKGDESRKEEKKVGREKNMKVASKGKSLIIIPRFSERGPDAQFQHSPKHLRLLMTKWCP